MEDFVDNKVKAPPKVSESFAGYTELHFKCIGEYKKPKEFLVEDYQADVNVVAEDGSQPIHLACLHGYNGVVRNLLKFGANVNAKLGRDLFFKYSKELEWRDDFGDEMTLITFAVLYDKVNLVRVLIEGNVNLEVRSSTNKTLLMYALYNDSRTAELILSQLKYQKLINVRDDDGFHAVHYLLHPNKYGKFRYDTNQFNELKEEQREFIISPLMRCGADMNATINGDPKTLLLNMAAYRSSVGILTTILPNTDYITKSNALYYATVLDENSKTLLRLSLTHNEDYQWGLLRRKRETCTALILKDLVNRITFGLPVPESEKQLMYHLIKEDKTIKKIVDDYKRDFINNSMKNEVIKFGNQIITYYDFVLETNNYKKLQLLVKDKAWRDDTEQYFSSMDIENFDKNYFNYLTIMRIGRAWIRIELLRKLKEIEQMEETIPLPYELVLDIIEFLNNRDLEKFINAFYYN